MTHPENKITSLLNDHKYFDKTHYILELQTYRQKSCYDSASYISKGCQSRTVLIYIAWMNKTYPCICEAKVNDDS